MNAVRLNIQSLRALRKELDKAKSARVRVGILGNKAERLDEDWNKEKINNPTLGATHEFGSIKRNIPARSFLRMPLMLFLPKRVDQIGRAVWRALILKRGITEALKDLGILSEQIVQEAFATGGFGKWPKWSARYSRWRMNWARAKSKIIGPVQPGSLLILSAQLRKGVTSRVVQAKAA